MQAVFENKEKAEQAKIAAEAEGKTVGEPYEIHGWAIDVDFSDGGTNAAPEAEPEPEATTTPEPEVEASTPPEAAA